RAGTRIVRHRSGSRNVPCRVRSRRRAGSGQSAQSVYFTGRAVMTTCTRRRLLSQTGRYAAAALIAHGLPRAIRATPLGKPVGIQLYTVKQEIGRDPAGTLRQLRRIGFREVETAGFGQLSAGQFRRLLDEAGLTRSEERRVGEEWGACWDADAGE